MTDGHNTSPPILLLLHLLLLLLLHSSCSLGGHISCKREAKNYVKILTFRNSTHLHWHMADDTMLRHKIPDNTFSRPVLTTTLPNTHSSFMSRNLNKRYHHKTNISHISETPADARTFMRADKTKVVPF